MLRTFLSILAAVTGLAVSRAALADATTRPSVKVAVVAFDVLGEAGHEWIGRAMQEGLATGLQKTPGINAVIVAGIGPVDLNGAIAAAKSVGADEVIFGSIQILEDQMRVGGQIVSANTSKPVGVLRCDGSVRDLFAIEDMLSERAARLINPPPAVFHTGISGAGHPAGLDLVGPTLTQTSSRYFDGDLSSITTPPARFRDDYDRYYYQSSSSSGCGYGCGVGYGVGWGTCGGFPAGNVLVPPAATIGTW